MQEVEKDKLKIIGCQWEAEDGINKASLTYWENAKRVFLQNKVALFSAGVLFFVVLLVIIGPYVSKYSIDEISILEKNATPSLKHWFGVDYEGRDIFIRVCEGGRVSLLIGLITACINIVIGLIYGGICGYYGGLIDDIVMRIVEIITSVPNLIIIIIVFMYMGSGIFQLIAAMSIAGWCNIARIVRGQLLKLKEQEFILAAQALGASNSRIISRHLITNIINIAIVSITLEIPLVVLNEITLSFIGFGVQKPLISWGTVAKQGYAWFLFYPHEVLIPGLIISITMISFNLFGEGLSDALDPKWVEN